MLTNKNLEKILQEACEEIENRRNVEGMNDDFIIEFPTVHALSKNYPVINFLLNLHGYR